MLAAEKNKDPYELVDPKFEGHNETEISYHIALLDDAGLLHGQDRSAIGVFRWSAGALSWAGHEFVEAARDEAPTEPALNGVGNRAQRAAPSTSFLKLPCRNSACLPLPGPIERVCPLAPPYREARFL